MENRIYAMCIQEEVLDYSGQVYVGDYEITTSDVIMHYLISNEVDVYTFGSRKHL